MDRPVKKRGRPRAFDERETLDRITQLFWKTGYSAASLDQIANTSGLNRPSLYAAFGNKKTIYLRALDAFEERMESAMAEAAAAEKGIQAKTLAVFDAALRIYTDPARDPGARGCFVLSTLPAEAPSDPDFQARLSCTLQMMENGFARLLSRDAKNPQQTAKLLVSILCGLSVRARAGELAEDLRQSAKDAVGIAIGNIC